MNEDDIQPTEPAAETAAPAESEPSEAKTEAQATEEAKTETAETTDPAEQDGGDDDDQDDGDKPKRPSRYQRLKRERDALQAEIAQLRNRPMADAVDDAAALDALVRKEIGDPPKEDDPRFKDDWFAFERALTAYETEKRIVAREIRGKAAQAKEAQQHSAGLIVEEFREQQAQARKQIADFDAVVAKAGNASAAVQQLVLESEKGALIQYHLAKNPALLDRLNGLSPLGVAKEIGRLEDRLSLPNPKSATKAASPISAPRGGAAPTVDLSKMSMDEYVAHRNKGAA